jgi:4-hydroxybenzoate polyprenyltransferase
MCGLATYTYFKRRWWGGPFYNGWIVAVLFLIGYNSGLRGPDTGFPDRVWLSLVSVLFGYANFVLVGYFKDISADRATGYNTLPVTFGRKASAIVSDIFAVIFCGTGVVACAMTMRTAQTIRYAPACVLLASSLCASVLTQIRLHATTTDEEAHRAIALSVHTYVLMFCAIAAANQPSWAPAMVLFYAGFVLTLSVRPERSQI